MWKKNDIKVKIKKPKMVQFKKFKLIFAPKPNYNGAQFCSEISKFGYFNNLQIILNRVKNYSYKSWTFIMVNLFKIKC